MTQGDPFLVALQQVRGASASAPPEDPFLAALSDVRRPASEDTRSGFARAYDAVFTPPEVISRGARTAADAIDAPTLDRSRLTSMGRGFVAGAVQGAANLLTPGDVALTATGLGPLARFIRGVKGGANVARTLQATADAATIGRGGERVLNAETPAEAAAGVAQIALGGASRAAARSQPRPTPPPVREPLALPAGPSYVGGVDGVVVPVGVDAPLPQAADLPDASFVRGVPAEYAQREVRGLLPPGPRFIAGEHAIGALDSLGDDPFVAVLAEM